MNKYYVRVLNGENKLHEAHDIHIGVDGTLSGEELRVHPEGTAHIILWAYQARTWSRVWLVGDADDAN